MILEGKDEERVEKVVCIYNVWACVSSERTGHISKLLLCERKLVLGFEKEKDKKDETSQAHETRAFKIYW